MIITPNINFHEVIKMKLIVILMNIYFLLTAFVGCTMPQVIQPLHLYDLRDGTKIEVFLQPKAEDHGIISSINNNGEQFQGEYIFTSDRVPNWPPKSFETSTAASNNSGKTPPEDFADAYGFGKNSQARPVGTGIIIGTDGTVIEIVFYRISADLKTGDGVGRDNKGRYYRIFLSTETL